MIMADINVKIEETVRVDASASYDVIIGKGLLENVGEISAKYIAHCRCVLVTDDIVNSLYAKNVEASLTASGFEVKKFVILHGENSKSLENYAALISFCAENALCRSDCLFALGGGVVGDLTGFVAATYLRGVRFVSLPTTLLAAVDSSVGGKTAINIPQGKNLVGAFLQPSLVICDYKTLDTLPSYAFSDGYAEIIKYGIINDREFFDTLKGNINADLGQIVARCVRNKRDIVMLDERDNAQRQLLNLGHTVGHAIEKCSSFSISHGHAVAIGIAIVARAGVKIGVCSKDECDEIISLLNAYGLPVDCAFSAKQLFECAISDKKRSKDTFTLIVPYGIGDTRIYKIKEAELEAFIASGLV